jgi:hypothetical protein
MAEAKARVDAARSRFPIARAASLQALRAAIGVTEGAALLDEISRRSGV